MHGQHVLQDVLHRQPEEYLVPRQLRACLQGQDQDTGLQWLRLLRPGCVPQQYRAYPYQQDHSIPCASHGKISLHAELDIRITCGMAKTVAGRIPPSHLHPLVATRCSLAATRRRTRSGLRGVSRTHTPNGRRASSTAFAIAAGGAMAPPSPTPLMPRGLRGEGYSRWISSISGISVA